MKIAVPTRENRVDEHFGTCESYTLFTLDEMGAIKSTEILPSQPQPGFEGNIAGLLHEKGVKVLLAGSMGNGAFTQFSNFGIKVYRGCSGNVRELTEAYIQGDIIDAGHECRHEMSDGHECSHSH